MDEQAQEYYSNEIERLNEVLALSRSANERLKADNESLAKELADIKTRRWFEVLETSVDERTGMLAVVKTVYRMQVESIRLEASPEMYMGMSGYLPEQVGGHA